MAKKANLSSTISTRERILGAAMQRFSKQSYDTTGLREIAADAGVDVAYVHRAFGSKRQLFAEVISTAVQTDRVLDDLCADLVEALTRKAVSRRRSARDIDPLNIAVHSLSSLEAVEVHRDFLEKELIAPLARQLEAPSAHRAALIAAFLAGLNILRNVVGIKELQESERGKLDPLLREVFEALAGDAAAVPHKPQTQSGRRK